MTAAEWLACDDPARTPEGADRRVSARKARLALRARLRGPRVRSLLAAPASRRAAEVAEAFADGAASRQGLGQARRKANAFARRGKGPNGSCSPEAYPANPVCLQDRNLPPFLHLPDCRLKQLRPPAGLLRDVFGNPFRPVAVDPSWLTANVVGLAASIYEERAFDRLPVLADALMDAGCDSDEVIGHCRGTGPHVRACWVVDLAFGKS